MCAGCAMTAASAATGFRTWLQSHSYGWLTPRRMRSLVGFSGSTPGSVQHPAQATHLAAR